MTKVANAMLKKGGLFVVKLFENMWILQFCDVCAVYIIVMMYVVLYVACVLCVCIVCCVGCCGVLWCYVML